jgi:quinol monooxygenase YgiN
VLVLTARLSVDPDRTVAFEALARELWEATHRSEHGCRRYEYVRLPEPGAYLVLMMFDDHDAFLAHQASEHHIRIAGGPMRELVRSVEIDFGAPVEGAFGSIDGVEPDTLDDLRVDGELVEHYRRRYPPPDFSRWR